jgi:hypothetical protein
MDLIGASHKESRQITALQECIRTSYINIVFLFGIQTVDCLFKERAHLYFIDHQDVVFSRLIMSFIMIPPSLLCPYHKHINPQEQANVVFTDLCTHPTSV